MGRPVTNTNPSTAIATHEKSTTNNTTPPLKNRRQNHRGLHIAIIATVLIGSLAVFHHKTFYHFGTVERGILYRSGMLNTTALTGLRHAYGINTIINLISEREKTENNLAAMEAQFCRNHDMKLVNIPMHCDTPPNAEQIARFLDIVTNPANQPVLMHCEQGVIRTGMMVAVYRKHLHNIPNEQIMAELPLFGHSIDGEARQPVRDFILNYQPSWADVERHGDQAARNIDAPGETTSDKGLTPQAAPST